MIYTANQIINDTKRKNGAAKKIDTAKRNGRRITNAVVEDVLHPIHPRIMIQIHHLIHTKKSVIIGDTMAVEADMILMRVMTRVQGGIVLERSQDIDHLRHEKSHPHVDIEMKNAVDPDPDHSLYSAHNSQWEGER